MNTEHGATGRHPSNHTVLSWGAYILLAIPLGLSAGEAAVGSAAFDEWDEFGTGATIPVAWGDFDNDGDLDLAVGNYGGQNELYINDGSGGFDGVQEFGAGTTFAIVWGDYDNDGDLDAAVGNNGTNYLYINQGDGTFDGVEKFGQGTTIAMAWGDYDNDGDLDLAVGNGILNPAEQNYLYINQGNDVFVGLPQFGMGQTDSLAWGDCDGDGDLDLAVGNGGFNGDQSQQNYLYIYNGGISYSAVPEFGTGDTATVAWFDSDNDGDLDLAVGNWDNGQSYLYVNNGDCTFVALPRFGAVDTNALAWGDYNHDGLPDLAVGNGDFGSAYSNYLYVNNGGNTFTEEAEFGLGSTDAVAWGDCDNDGDLDLAVGNEHSPLRNNLYTNTLDDAAYLNLHLVGHIYDYGPGYSNRDAIGAKVSVYEAGFLAEADHLLGFREIEAHGGFSSQNSVEASFGIPGRTTVDVQIIWPGSANTVNVTDLTGVAVGQRLTIHESEPMPRGSCCTVDASCEVKSAYECGDDTWTEDGVCEPNTCPRSADPLLIAAAPHDARKNRFVSFDPSPNASTVVAIEVRLSGMKRCSGDPAWSCVDDSDCDAQTGPCTQHTQVGTVLGWVGQPEPNGLARVVNAPVYREWPETIVQLGDCEIVPVATYELRATPDEVYYSEPLELGTIRKPDVLHYGDVVGVGTGYLPPLQGFTPPNGVNNVSDVQAILMTIQGPSTPSAEVTWVDMHGNGNGSAPNLVLNVSDVQRILFGIKGTPYTETPEQLDPADCP